MSISSFEVTWIEQLPSTSFGDQIIDGHFYYKAVFVNKPKTLENGPALDAVDCPILAAIWDNDVDTIYNPEP